MRKSIQVFIKLFVIVLFVNALSRLLLLIFNFQMFDASLSQHFHYFFCGFRFDISAIAYANFLFVFLFFLPYLQKNTKLYKRLLFWFWLIPNLIILIPNIADAFYYPFVFRRSTYDLLLILFSMKSEMNYLVVDFITDFWPAYFIFAILTTIYILSFRRIFIIPPERQRNLKTFFTQTIIFLICILITIIGMRGGFQKKPISMLTAGRYAPPAHTPLVMNSAFSIIRTFGKTGIEKKIFFNNTNEMKLYFNACKQYTNKQFTNKNVVIIILESFSNEHLNSQNNTQMIDESKNFAPFLDSLIHDGFFCERAYANNKRSIEGIPAIISSMPSLMNTPYILSQYSNNIINSFPDILKNMGYTSSFFHGGQNGTMNFDSYAYLSGFDKYYGMSEYPDKNDFDGKWGIWDEPYLQYVANEMNNFTEPFFAAVFTLSSHHPYQIPNIYQSTLPKGPLPIHQAIAYTDLALKNFFKKASEYAWYQNTLFVITSDHTSEPYVHKYKSTEGMYSIPLLFYDPGSRFTGKTNSVCQQSDILPSVLDYLGYNKPFTSFGNSVFQKNRYGFQISYLGDKYQIISDSLVLYFIEDTPVKLWNFNSDTNDQTNLIEDSAYNNQIKAMTLLYQSFIQQYNNSLINNKIDCTFAQ